MTRLRFAAVLLLVASALIASNPTVVWAQSRGKNKSPAAASEAKTHVVRKGQTLGAIAREHGVELDALCRANGIQSKDTIRPGQSLTIPQPGVTDSSASGSSRNPGAASSSETATRPAELQQELRQLAIPNAPDAYYFEPTGSGRMSLRPVIMVFHGRGGNPSAFCTRWAPIARPHGWLVCPSAPHPHGDGFSWENDWVAAKGIATASLNALRGKYARRVQLRGNTLIGYSEGAFVAMNIGVRDSRTYNRWLILAADDRYWGAAAPQLVARARDNLQRVYLITGQLDGVHGGTIRAQGRLRDARVLVDLADPVDMGHEVALETRRGMYKEALTWLQK
ncbi:MAG: LysM peptidoglycan-binding domain-containing protein [Polyangiaceae bacterium]|nr:LysM peptidoglycan-binding domain-containing protein [Polyangiaceae bacterium]